MSDTEESSAAVPPRPELSGEYCSDDLMIEFVTDSVATITHVDSESGDLTAPATGTFTITPATGDGGDVRRLQFALPEAAELLFDVLALSNAVLLLRFVGGARDGEKVELTSLAIADAKDVIEHEAEQGEGNGCELDLCVIGTKAI
jgi:hypothetical protein